jgi:hypothetical protein
VGKGVGKSTTEINAFTNLYVYVCMSGCVCMNKGATVYFKNITQYPVVIYIQSSISRQKSDSSSVRTQVECCTLGQPTFCSCIKETGTSVQR